MPAPRRERTSRPSRGRKQPLSSQRADYFVRNKQQTIAPIETRQASLQNLTAQPDDKTPTETVGWCFTHRVEVLLSVEPSRTRGPRRRRAQWPVYSLALSKLSTPNRQKIVTRFSCA